MVYNKERITGWIPAKLGNTNFKEVIEKAIKEFHISRKRAIAKK